MGPAKRVLHRPRGTAKPGSPVVTTPQPAALSPAPLLGRIRLFGPMSGEHLAVGLPEGVAGVPVTGSASAEAIELARGSQRERRESVLGTA